MIARRLRSSLPIRFLSPEISTHDLAEINQRFDDQSYPVEHGNLVKSAHMDGGSLAQAFIQQTAIHMEWVQTMLNSEKCLDQNILS